MTYYIQSNARPINSKVYETVAAAVADFRKPAYAGAAEAEVIMTGEASFKSRGVNYEVIKGNNPKLIRAAAPKATPNTSRSAFNASGHFRGAGWLSREMDRADSDF